MEFEEEDKCEGRVQQMSDILGIKEDNTWLSGERITSNSEGLLATARMYEDIDPPQEHLEILKRQWLDDRELYLRHALYETTRQMTILLGQSLLTKCIQQNALEDIKWLVEKQDVKVSKIHVLALCPATSTPAVCDYIMKAFA